jgi:hypothetical protein
MDINIKDYIENGTGASKLTSSVSLDQEYDDGCTLVIPGFWKHLQEWYQRRIQRGVPEPGVTTEARQSYLPEDVVDFGAPVTCPLPPGGVRITRPDIIHGSTNTAKRQRRVIYPWHTSIAENHHDLDSPGQHSWEEISACHRDLEAPTRGVGGELVTKDRPPYRVPAAVSMASSSALCDALIGRRKYTDPSVLMEVAILLGDDDEAAMNYIASTRAKLIDNYLESVTKVKQLEPLVYPENSFVKSQN